MFKLFMLLPRHSEQAQSTPRPWKQKSKYWPAPSICIPSPLAVTLIAVKVVLKLRHWKTRWTVLGVNERKTMHLGPDEFFLKTGKQRQCHGAVRLRGRGSRPESSCWPHSAEPSTDWRYCCWEKITIFRAPLRFKANQKTILNLQRGTEELKRLNNSSFLHILWAPRIARTCLILWHLTLHS